MPIRSAAPDTNTARDHQRVRSNNLLHNGGCKSPNSKTHSLATVDGAASTICSSRSVIPDIFIIMAPSLYICCRKEECEWCGGAMEGSNKQHSRRFVQPLDNNLEIVFKLLNKTSLLKIGAIELDTNTNRKVLGAHMRPDGPVRRPLAGVHAYTRAAALLLIEVDGFGTSVLAAPGGQHRLFRPFYL